jgi:hypothetical protein
MNLLVSYDVFYSNWYVGEFYQKFTEKLLSLNDVNVEVVNSNELASRHNLKTDYNNGLPSVFSPFNLIIQNKDNNKTFIHSWNDFAPAILDKGSGIEVFDVVKFACVSRLDQSYVDNARDGIIVQPSVYLLENWDEHSLIELNRHGPKTSDKVYFNGMCHGIREDFRKVLNQTDLFDFKNKTGDEFKHKPDYYKEMSDYKYGFNLDGAAKICYRDLECFGMGLLLFREKLNVLTHNPLVDGEHYITLIDHDIITKIGNPDHHPYIIDKIDDKINSVINDDELVTTILSNARSWYEENCLPENQINIILSFLEDFKIFE